jgi:hypothetical protein
MGIPDFMGINAFWRGKYDHFGNEKRFVTNAATLVE